jgi:epoxyqueuosine reductase
VNLSFRIEQKARELGFGLFGITHPSTMENYSLFERWLLKGNFGEMKYLDSQLSRKMREDPGLLMASCKSIIVVGLAYDFNKKNFNSSYKIALFSQQPDYHQVIRQKLKSLLKFIIEITGSTTKGLVCCDTSPVLEKELAQRAGLGRIGKNSLLISAEIGSFFNLGELLLNIDLPYPQIKEDDPCGDCELCIQSCPTKCIDLDRTLAADHCISYLTIEHKAIIPMGLRPVMDSWVYGCDVCQLVCPWNQKIIKEKMPGHQKVTGKIQDEILIKRIEQFLLENEPLIQRRSTKKNILRNYAICLGNSHQRQTIPVLVQLLEGGELEIRAAAAWALGEIGVMGSREALKGQLLREEQNDVRVEIQYALKKLE